MLKPLGKRILVKVEEKKQEHSLLIIPDKEENIKQGLVLVSGVPEVKGGDTVLVNTVGAVKTAHGLLVAEANILGIVEG